MPFVNILNKTTLKLELKLFYIKKGESKETSVESSSFKKDMYQSLYIPNDAKNISCEVYYEAETGFWGLFTETQITTNTTMCAEVSGNIKKPVLKQIKCKDFKNQDHIYIRNKSNIPIKGELIYFLEGDKLGHKIQSSIISVGKNSTMYIPLNANSMQFSILTETSKSKWERTSQVVGFSSTPLKKCYDVTGTLTQTSLKEYACALSNNRPSLGTSNINGYIKFLNSTTTKIRTSLTYYINGSKNQIKTNVILVNKSDTLSIPSNANNISFSIYYLNKDSNWINIDDPVLLSNHPIQKCYLIAEINGIFSFIPKNCSKLP